MQFLEPEPLRHGGLNQRGGCIGIIFEQLGWCEAVVGQVEPAIDAEKSSCSHDFKMTGIAASLIPQARPPIVFDDGLRRVNAEKVQGVRGGFQRIHPRRG